MTQTQAVLKMLRDAGEDGVTTGDFLKAYIPRFSARIYDLGLEGYEIDVERLSKSSFRYVLVHEPDLESSGGADSPRPVAAVRSEAAQSSVPAPAPSPAGKATDGECEGRDSTATLFDFAEIDIAPPRRRSWEDAA